MDSQITQKQYIQIFYDHNVVREPCRQLRSAWTKLTIDGVVCKQY